MGAVLNTVYNNYLAAYSPRQLTKYDTHKKSELRSVYNSIVKLNKDAPWYLPTTNKDTQHYAVSLKEDARELHNAIAQLGGLEQDSMFRKKKCLLHRHRSSRSSLHRFRCFDRYFSGIRSGGQRTGHPTGEPGIFSPGSGYHTGT